MKIKWSRIKRWMKQLAVAAGIGAAAQVALGDGGAIDFSGTLNQTNTVVVLTNNATFPLPKNGDGVGIMLSAVTSAIGSGTNGSETCYFDLLDATGSLFCTSNQMIATMGLNGSTNVSQFFYFNATNFWGATSARLGKWVSNQTNTGVTASGKWMYPIH